VLLMSIIFSAEGIIGADACLDSIPGKIGMTLICNKLMDSLVIGALVIGAIEVSIVSW